MTRALATRLRGEATASILSIMKLRPRISAPSIGLVCALAAILFLLAMLQVRWSNQVSQAQRDRMRGNLYIAVTRFRRNFYLELFRICWAFQNVSAGPVPKILQAYADHYDDWMGASAHPSLVAGLYVWSTGHGKNLQLFHFSPASARFVKAVWPPELEALRARLEPQSDPASPPPRASEESWVIDEQVPALYHRWRSAGTGKRVAGASQTTDVRGGVIIELDMNFIRRDLLPMLADRYFRGPRGFIYRVTIMSGSHPAGVIYQSVPGPPGAGSPTGDMVVDLLFTGRRSSEPQFRENGTAVSAGTGGDADLPGAWPESADSFAFRGQKRPFALIVPASQTANWKLIVRHRAGSVEAAVLHLRRRNLAVSFSVLALLAASMALILVSARRAHRLAKLQIDFVAGVSHELRTPLAVICSAAENLVDGVAAGKDQVMNYGALVLSEGRRLSQMVDQILAFATTQAGYPSYHLRPTSVPEVLEAVLNAAMPMLEPAGMVAEKKIEPDLPRVMADRSALERCLQNLISNAIKYAGEGRWIGIRASAARNKEKLAVEVTVEDHGAGIPAQDLPHIFEPFYRGKTEIHGTGLGLSLARDIAEAMGGRLSVKSSPGCGSRFTLRLPALASEQNEPLHLSSLSVNG